MNKEFRETLPYLAAWVVGSAAISLTTGSAIWLATAAVLTAVAWAVSGRRR